METHIKLNELMLSNDTAVSKANNILLYSLLLSLLSEANTPKTASA